MLTVQTFKQGNDMPCHRYLLSKFIQTCKLSTGKNYTFCSNRRSASNLAWFLVPKLVKTIRFGLINREIYSAKQIPLLSKPGKIEKKKILQENKNFRKIKYRRSCKEYLITWNVLYKVKKNIPKKINLP